jgi:acyl carrier protein
MRRSRLTQSNPFKEEHPCMNDGHVSSEKVREEAKRLIAELTERDSSEIADTALFTEDLGVDSLMAIELMVSLDKRYKINIPEAEFNKIKNVDDAVKVVMRHIQGSARE